MDKIALQKDQLAALFDIAVNSAVEAPDLGDHPALIHAAQCGYAPTAKVGEGGMAEVWRAIDSNTGRDVAIKVPHRHNEAAQTLLDHEAEALSEMQPPGVATLIRKGGQGQTRFLILEFVHGDSLANHLRQAGHSLDAAIKTMIRVCQSAEHVHHAGFVHGDLKPSNILIRPDGSAVLIDFGLAARLGQQDARVLGRNYRGGTKRYLPPEVGASPALPRAAGEDVYSLGTMFSESLQELSMEPSEGIKAVLDRAMAEDPAARFGSMQDFIAALTHEHEALLQQAQPPRRHFRAALTAAAAAVALTLLVGLPLTRPWRNATTPPGADPGHITLAASMLAQGDSAEAARKLQAVRKDERGWEWRHLWTAATTPPAVTTLRFPRVGMSSAIGPDCQSFAVGTMSGNVELFTPTGETRVLMPGNRGVTHLTSDGGSFLTTYADEVWRVPVDGGPAKGGQIPAQRLTVCWPTGKDQPDQVAVYDSSANEALAVDLNTLNVLSRRPTELALTAASNAGWALLGQTNQADRIHIEVVQGVFRGVIQDELADREIPMCMDVDADASLAAVGTSAGRVLIYDLTGQAARIEHPMEDGKLVSAVVIDTNENRMFAASAKELYVMELNTGRRLLSLPIDTLGIPRSIQWDPPSGTLAVVTDLGSVIWKAPPNADIVALR